MNPPPTTTDPGTQHSLVDQNLKDALATVASEIGRTDNKTSFLLAFNGAVIAGLVGSANKDLPADSRSSPWPPPPSCCCSSSCPDCTARTARASPTGPHATPSRSSLR